MLKYLLVACGGVLGALVRYWCVDLVTSKFSLHFPLGTLFVNIFGCLLIGLVMGASNGCSSTMRLFFVVGFLGAFTTFSAFSYETVMLLRSHVFLAIGNVVAHVVLCLGATIIGMTCRTMFLK